MSPRASSSTPRSASSASAPYPRRAAGQPKSSRQQFSACGACRMRRFVYLGSSLTHPHCNHRVRCDLKDLPITQTSGGTQPPSCSNCKERGIKCVYVLFSSSPILRSYVFPSGMNLLKSKLSNFYGVVGVYNKWSESYHTVTSLMAHSME
jgi:hypothetical protein